MEYNYDYEYSNRKGEIVKPTYTPLHFDLQSKIEIIKKAKGVFHLKSGSDNNKVMDFTMKTGPYRLYFNEFQRSSSWDEYIGYKCLFDPDLINFLENKPVDKTIDLINLFDQLFNSS